MISFCDLKRLNDSYKHLIEEAVSSVVQSGWYINGKNCRDFEAEFSSYCESNYCVGVGNGFDAIKLILRALDLNEGDEVLVPTNTFIATFLAVTECGYKPVPVDIDTSSYDLCLDDMKSKLTARTKALIAVHLYGMPCEMDELVRFCDDNELVLVEDAAQAHGATYNGKKIGSFGVASAFSFYPGKNLGALGDGGAVVTSDKKLGDKIRVLANYGARERYVHNEKGVNSRLDELQAAVLRVKLKQLDADNKSRQNISLEYINRIENKAIVLPNLYDERGSVWHQFVIRTSARDELHTYLEENGVQTLIHYPIPCHKQKAYGELDNYSLPNAERCADEILSLPIQPYQTNLETNIIIDLLNKWQKGN